MNKDQENNLEGELIGLDVGAKRIGVARVNTIARIAEPLSPILTDDGDAFEAVLAAISENSAQAVVIGLPRGLDGQETAQTEEIKQFAADLSQKTNTPLYLIDEAGTSKEAEELLKINPSASKDSLAASIFLEDFVNADNKAQLRY